MIINNKDHFSNETFDKHSPINTDWLLDRLRRGTAEDAERAIADNLMNMCYETRNNMPELFTAEGFSKLQGTSTDNYALSFCSEIMTCKAREGNPAV